jgi:signal transduction histidine kinase
MRFGRRTVRMRLTLLYGGLFLLSGVALLAVTYVLVRHATRSGLPEGADGPAPDALPDSLPGRSDVDAVRTLAAQRADQLHELLVQSTIALGLMSVVSIGLGWVVAGRVLRPLSTITATARDITATNLHRRLAMEGPADELRELGDTIDDLLARLSASFESQRRFIANASHELRTPLTRQRTLVQLALSDPRATMGSLRAAHERVLDATQHQARLIDALLTLAKGERGLDRRTSVDLAAAAEDVLLATAAEAAGRGVRLSTDLTPARTRGDPRLVERLVVNLVDNALRYNAPGGRVEVTTATRSGRAVLTVANTGPVVPPDQLDRLFHPFQQLTGTRTRPDGGLGLGLSIVQAITTAHNATVEAHPPPAGGLEIVVAFPAA